MLRVVITRSRWSQFSGSRLCSIPCGCQPTSPPPHTHWVDKNWAKGVSFRGVHLENLLRTSFIFAVELLLPAEHHPGACEENKGIAGGLVHVPEGSEGHFDPGAPSGGPVRHPSLATFPPRAWEDLRLCDALSDSLPGEG